MTATLAFEEGAWDRLRAGLDAEVETAWVLLTRRVRTHDSKHDTFLVHQIVDVADHSYRVREGDRLSLGSNAWYPSFVRADADDLVPFFAHTHPRMDSRHSATDLRLDEELSRVASMRIGNRTYGSFVVGGTYEEPEFDGRFTSDASNWSRVDRVRIVGEQLTLMTHDGAIAPGVFDRQIRAFGEEGQRALEHLCVGVIGAGGTGSAVVEQLARIGVRDIVVIDPQELADTNVTRVYGSALEDAGTPKVDVAQANAARVGLGASVRSVNGSLLTRSTTEELAHCDVIFGCTDDHAGRLIATRLPQAMLQLLIDCGVVIDSRDGVLFDILARVTVVTPTSACLMCTDDVDPARAAAEALSEAEQEQRVREGYAPELDHTDPSVITYTTLVASMAMNELLSRLFGYADPTPANKLVARVASRALSTSRYQPRGSHRCGRRELIGVGLREPFLDYGWPDE